ncbi:hypothetical protein HC766_01310 [Candidatus Gracilibacteria bacterium]|nr:hypothetical protein [Thermales bacterium]NJS41012.1 hypothetical protein [Candidatus Gracilibacteria bacterium]
MFVAVSALGTVGLEAQDIPGRDVLCGGDSCPVTGSSDFDDADQNTIASFIINVASFITFIVGALAVLFLVYGGFLFVVNPGGGDENAKKGQTIVRNAIIGLIIAIVAYSIVNLIGNLVQGEFVAN